jgi:UDPglucose 6-dehydrogenase
VVVAHDPAAMSKAADLLPGVEMAPNPYAAATAADALAIVTEWPDYISLNWELVRDAMNRPVVVDGRNCLDPETMASIGFDYVSVGRPTLGAVTPVSAAAGGAA